MVDLLYIRETTWIPLIFIYILKVNVGMNIPFLPWIRHGFGDMLGVGVLP